MGAGHAAKPQSTPAEACRPCHPGAAARRHTVAIIGLGLIGGSLGLALRQVGGYRVLGYARRPETAQSALQLGAVDAVTPSVAAAADADLVVVAVPVLATGEIFRGLAGHLAPRTVVTDVGSTKVAVERWAAALLPSARFVGGHPMAGKELAGIEHADGRLFRGRTWAIVPPVGAHHAAVQRVARLASDVGALPLEIDAASHDAAVAATSHLPFVVSALLAHSVYARGDWPALRPLAGTGLRDTTRLASGDPVMHRDICVANLEPILAALDQFAQHAAALAALLREPNHHQELLIYFQRVKAARDRGLQGQTLDAAHRSARPADLPPGA